MPLPSTAPIVKSIVGLSHLMREAINRGHQRPSEATRGHQRIAEAHEPRDDEGHQWPSAAGGHPRESRALAACGTPRGHLREQIACEHALDARDEHASVAAQCEEFNHADPECEQPNGGKDAHQLNLERPRALIDEAEVAFA